MRIRPLASITSPDSNAPAASIASFASLLLTGVALLGCGSATDGPSGVLGAPSPDAAVSLSDPATFELDAGSGADAAAPAKDCKPNLTGTLRDFRDSHPDFERFASDTGEKGIVRRRLGADSKPVYDDAIAHGLVASKASFDAWYRDVPGVNVSSPFTVHLIDNGDGTATFDDQVFFPLDGLGFGNEGRAHNFHFTFELHTTFAYHGGEVFRFVGDDDLWVFINGALAIDLGGVHPALAETIRLDDQAGALGLVKGTTYALDVFQAERHTTASHFRIDTSITFNNCDPIIR